MARCSSYDPLEKFRFRLSWTNSDGSETTPSPRAGFHDAQLPKRATTSIIYREGIDPDINQKSAGLSNMEDITLSRGLLPGRTSDGNAPQRDLYLWMSAVHKPTSGHFKRAGHPGRLPDSAANKYKKDVTIEMLDREGSVARKWVVYNAWPSNFVPGSDLDASDDGEKSLESLTLSYEDFKEIDVISGEEADTSSSLPT
jgi:phage tail-like protein